MPGLSPEGTERVRLYALDGMNYRSSTLSKQVDTQEGLWILFLRDGMWDHFHETKQQYVHVLAGQTLALLAELQQVENDIKQTAREREMALVLSELRELQHRIGVLLESIKKYQATQRNKNKFLTSLNGTSHAPSLILAG
jgi:hypothetical protein